MRNTDIERRYKTWWEGKQIRLNPGFGDFRLCKQVEFLGPPSGVYGSVKITWEDGSYDFVRVPERKFKPRKCDVEVNEPIKECVSIMTKFMAHVVDCDQCKRVLEAFYAEAAHQPNQLCSVGHRILEGEDN